jgi:hypothetical protein
VPSINLRAERTLNDLEVDAVAMFTEGADPLSVKVLQVNDNYVLQLGRKVRGDEETLDIKLGHVKAPEPKGKAKAKPAEPAAAKS